MGAINGILMGVYAVVPADLDQHCFQNKIYLGSAW